jgi:hypothetical protein
VLDDWPPDQIAALAAGLDAFADAVATTGHLSTESQPPPQE